MSALSQCLAQALEDLLDHDDLPVPEVLPSFYAQSIPSISIEAYLARITKYAPQCSGDVQIISAIYLDRILQKHQSLVLSYHNIHRFVMIANLIALKFYSDIYYSNAYFAKVGGVTCAEINQLEVQFLSALNFDLTVEMDQFTSYKSEILKYSPHLELDGEETLASAFLAHSFVDGEQAQTH